jgi:hypothetical protein
MATATTLTQAAKQSWTNLAVLSEAGTLRAKLLAFSTAVNAQLDQGLEGNHPVLNWVAVLWAFSTTMSAVAADWSELAKAAEIVYRLCFMGQVSSDQAMITAPQATAILAAYNAQF